MSKSQQQRLATLKAIVPRGTEVARIPRVCYLSARSGGEVHQQVYLVIGIVGHYVGKVAEIPSVHADYEVETLVVPFHSLPCGMPLARDAMSCKHPPCRWVYGIAYLLRGRCRRLDVEFVLEMRLSHEVLHDIFSHWRAADVAVADE